VWQKQSKVTMVASASEPAFLRITTMPVITERTPIRFHDELPDKTDVLVIGGGIAGIMTAWFLQKAGRQVVVCEKGRVAGEQSCRNWGFVRQAGRDAAELPIMMDCMRTWEELQESLGDAVGFRRPGSVFTSKNDSELQGYAEWVDQVGIPHGLDCKMITAREMSNIPGIPQGSFKGALYTPSDGTAEPFTAVTAIAEALRAKGGVSIRENCAVRLLDIQGGEVVGAHTEEGTIEAEQVLLAAGLWTGRLLHNHGLRLPQLLANTTIARTAATPEQQHLAFGHGEACFRSRVDGGYNLMPGEIMEHEFCFDTLAYGFDFIPALKKYYRNTSVIPGFYEGFFSRLFPQRRWNKDQVTPFEKTRVLNPRLSHRHLRKIEKRAAQHLPDFAKLPIEEAWTGSTDMTPDMLPALGTVGAYPGLYIAAGLSGHGFGLGPGIGKVIADHMLGEPEKYDLSAFRLERFSKKN
jgi:glycine/D-amino acid oxidase-like deaminating enzyme